MIDIDTYVAECARFRADVEKLIVELGSFSPWPAPIEWSGFNLMHGRFHDHI